MEYQFNLTLWEQYLASLRIAFRKGPLLLMHALYPALGIFLAIDQWRRGVVSIWAYVSLLVLLAFTPLVTMLAVLVRRGQSRGAFSALIVRVTDEGIEQQTQIGDTKVAWGQLLTVRETSRFFFFFVTNRLAIVLPTRVVSDESEQVRLRELIRAHTGVKSRLLK